MAPSSKTRTHHSTSRNCGTFGAFLGRGVCVQHLARPACSRLAKAATGRSNPYQSTASCNAVHTAALLCVADCSMQCFASDSACADASWAENADHIKPDVAVEVGRRCPAAINRPVIVAGLPFGFGGKEDCAKQTQSEKTPCQPEPCFRAVGEARRPPALTALSRVGLCKAGICCKCP